MADFRCNLLDESGDILIPTNIIAASLDEALRQAFELLRASNREPSASRRVYAFEVWLGLDRLFPDTFNPTPADAQHC